MSLETFTLVRERCTLSNLNIRTEMHGDERQRAIDLQFDFSGANNLLAKLHQELRHSFYKPQDTRDMVTDDHTPVLRFPLMGPVSWDLEIPRTRLQLHGESPADDVVLGDGKTNKFRLTLMDGGTVKWHFRVQFSNPDDKAIAGLSRFLNDTIPVSLECKALEDEPDNFEQVEQLSLTSMSEARQKAEDLFATPGTDMAIIGVDPGAGDDQTVFHNDGVQPGDAGHSYTATPADDQDFGEVKAPADTVTVASVHDGSVDAIVTPIGKGRRTGRKVAGGANLE